MLFRIFLFCLVSIGYVSSPSPDIVSALTDINRAISAGRHLARELRAHVSGEEVRLSKLRQLIQRLNSALDIHSTSDTANSTNLVTEQQITANPVSAYLTILRLSSNWSNELSTLLEDKNIDLGDAEAPIAGHEKPNSRTRLFWRLKRYTDMLPDETDVQGALDAMIRLQQTYNISSADIAEGKMLPSSQSPSLTDWQCMQLGQRSYNLTYFDQATEWFLVVLGRIDEKRRTGKTEEESDDVLHENVYDHLSYALGRVGRYNEALEAAKKLLTENPTSVNGVKSKAFYENELEQLNGNDPPHIVYQRDVLDGTESSVFDHLCRKANEWVPPNSKMSCRYSTPHPYFKLGPLKEETLLEDPLVILFHDFITKDEVEELIEISKPKLNRAMVRNSDTGSSEMATYRVTKSAWLKNDLNDLTKRLNKRIRMATGLNIDHGEELQVANYGLGGYYAPHFDYARHFEFDVDEKLHGNRIATTMIYLTPVELGGGTAFTKANLVVKPVARSMVFWYNLLRSGKGDVRSRHGACPVLSGNKWVMNKWIRAAGQEFTRPCGLEPEPFNPEEEYIDLE